MNEENAVFTIDHMAGGIATSEEFDLNGKSEKWVRERERASIGPIEQL